MYQLMRLFRPLTKACVDTFVSMFYAAKYLPWFISIPFAALIYAFFFMWLVPGTMSALETQPSPGVSIGNYLQALLIKNAGKVEILVTILGYGLVAIFAAYGLLNALRAARFSITRKLRVKKAWNRRADLPGAGGRASMVTAEVLSEDEKLLLGKVLAQSRSWQLLQEEIDKLGLQLRPKGSGFAVYRSRSAVSLGSLSGLGLGVSFVTLKRRLGNPPPNLTPMDMGVK